MTHKVKMADVTRFDEGLNRLHASARFGQTFSKVEIARACGVSPQAIEQREERILNKVRRMFGLSLKTREETPMPDFDAPLRSTNPRDGTAELCARAFHSPIDAVFAPGRPENATYARMAAMVLIYENEPTTQARVISAHFNRTVATVYHAMERISAREIEPAFKAKMKILRERVRELYDQRTTRCETVDGKGEPGVPQQSDKSEF